ncbi:aspartate kinase [Pyrococcus abyssi]|uniref:Aspartate kinase n=1 Tax=Pyrococcus abyssi (strain GE5 / Orsay) TaxID=272844 RepID=Q9UZV6_PYRAB|nr:aspartate kinase [Pyrococcus abyssi]CAB49950.1 lysC like2 aspartate kinase related [Pyrococcus abyssi GE5]CCE70449.1 TPA: aspartate kinase [Pyrococcus abyssi GE5]
MVYKLLVVKFGGSSVRYAFEEALELVKYLSERIPIVVVVSALKGVTDELIRFANGDKGALPRIERIHEEFLNYHGLNTKISISFRKDMPPEALRDEIISLGERISAKIFAEGLELLGIKSKVVDPLEFLIAKGEFGDAYINIQESKRRAGKLIRLIKSGVIPVIPGFYGNLNGFRVTFGRGGSDYSATALARILDSRCVLIMSDVEGIFTADPKLVPSARLIPYLSYEEIKVAAKLGMKALHWKAVDPVVGDIPIIFGKTKDWKFGTIVLNARSNFPIIVHRVREDFAEIFVVGRNISLPGFLVEEEREDFVKIVVAREDLPEAIREIHREVVEREEKNLRTGNNSELWARI